MFTSKVITSEKTEAKSLHQEIHSFQIFTEQLLCARLVLRANKTKTLAGRRQITSNKHNKSINYIVC